MESEKQEKIKILHVTFNLGIGGTEQVIRQLVSNLSPDQYVNSLLCIDGHVGEIGEQIRAAGMQVHTLKRVPGFDPSLIRAIRELIKHEQIDLVHCHQYTPWIYGWLGSRGTGAKVVFTEHGRFHPDKYRFKAVLVNPLMAMFTGGVVAISNATRNALARYEFVPPRKIRVIYNGITGLVRDQSAVSRVRQKLGIPEGACVMGTVARLDPVKNQAMMLQAFVDVIRQHPESWLLIVGDGPERQNLEQQALDLGIHGRVIFTGFRPHPADYLAAMDIFLLTSHTEGTSMTLLEAMSLAIPVIATAVGGSPEIVQDGKTGVLISTDSPKALASEMTRLLSDKQLRDRMGTAGRSRFETTFSIDPMVSGYEELYRQVLQRGWGNV